jgi:protein gp37
MGKAHRHPELWEGERRRTSANLWLQPFKWNRRCAELGIRERVFTNSLADFLDNQVPSRWRDDAWHRIDQCRCLDWMILSKRPENGPKMLPDPRTGTPEWGDGWSNVWFGTTVEDRKRKYNIEKLRRIPARVRFLSIEPLLEDLGELDLTGIHLVIVGGESGPKARPMHPDWARSIRDQCEAAGVPFFFKQHGEWVPLHASENGEGHRIVIDASGRDVSGSIAAQDHTCAMMFRVGKKRAGRMLDGRTHDEMPQPAERRVGDLFGRADGQEARAI